MTTYEEPHGCYNGLCVYCWLVNMMHNDPRYTAIVEQSLREMIL